MMTQGISSTREQHGVHLPQLMMAGEFVVKSGWSLGPRELSEYELVYFPIGSQTVYRHNGVSYELNEPCFVFTRPGERHDYTFDPERPTRHLFIHFVWNWQSPMIQCIPTVSVAAKMSFVPNLLQHILLLANCKPELWRDRCSKMLFTAIGELEAETNSNKEVSDIVKDIMPSQVSQAIHYIEQHLQETLEVRQIAQFVGWTHEHFTRVFSQHVGTSPRAFILNSRIERASQLLVQESLSIKEIAYRVGFQDEHYFSRTFTREKGVTATQYREDFSDPRVRHLAPIEAYDTLYPLNRYFLSY